MKRAFSYSKQKLSDAVFHCQTKEHAFKKDDETLQDHIDFLKKLNLFILFILRHTLTFHDEQLLFLKTVLFMKIIN